MTQTATLNEDVPVRIHGLLQQQGKSRAALARELGVSTNYVCRRLRGEVSFNLDEVDEIAEVLGVPVEQLLGLAA